MKVQAVWSDQSFGGPASKFLSLLFFFKQYKFIKGNHVDEKNVKAHPKNENNFINPPTPKKDYNPQYIPVVAEKKIYVFEDGTEVLADYKVILKDKK